MYHCLWRQLGYDGVCKFTFQTACVVDALYKYKIPPNALVLEVGSGGNPYPRVKVLLEAYEETRERHWVPLIHDRPTVFIFWRKSAI